MTSKAAFDVVATDSFASGEGPCRKPPMAKQIGSGVEEIDQL